MPGVTKYNLVDDVHDLRIPMHNDEVFQHGVCFEAKYIGSLEVGRPGSRMEIVAAMRRIRYEFKLKNIKKKKVNIVVSTDSVKVILRKKKKRKGWTWDESAILVSQDPIQRIFYVSHDAQDLKIFSYIARDGLSNVFRCNVFKSKRKSQAVRIVRTVGQAFDVCHQLTLQQSPDSLEEKEEKAEDTGPATKKLALSEETDLEASTEESIDCVASTDTQKKDKVHVDGEVCEDPPLLLNSPVLAESAPGQSAVEACCSVEQQVQLLQKQLQQQEQQAQAATSQVHMLQEQLSVEVLARTEAQTRVQRLLQQNTDLLRHISLLVKQIQELELKAAGQLTSMRHTPVIHGSSSASRAAAALDEPIMSAAASPQTYHLSSVGSQDSLLEITFRAQPALTPSCSMAASASQQQICESSWVSSLASPCSPSADTSPLGSTGVRLECFRFSSRGLENQDQSQEPGVSPSDGAPDDSILLGEQVLGALELLRFRESGIGSEYESNTDESDDRDSWGHGDIGQGDSSVRLFNVLNADSLSDSLGEEAAV